MISSRNVTVLSAESTTDRIYGQSIVQYKYGDSFVSFIFSDVPVDELDEENVIQEILEDMNERAEIPSWDMLPDKLLELFIESNFDMLFIGNDDPDFTDAKAEALFDYAYDKGLDPWVRYCEDDCYLTIYAGAMTCINWYGHKYFGNPCLENLEL